VIPSANALGLFCLASVALAVVPGPAVTYIVTQSVDKGRRAGLASALGVASGGLVHVVAATVGLSALIASSAHAFTTVKLVGAIYLVYVGVRRILSKDVDAEVEQEPATERQLYLQGVVVNVLNPKTALFFLAFLPQFVDADRGSVPAQVAFLGLLFALIALASDAAYALLADVLARRLRRSGTGARIRRWLSGGIFIALGVTAATAHRAT
jgi:threonine/homoserine/homoserine lactone efflux protein